MKARVLNFCGKLRGPAGRGLLVALGIVLGQVVLYAPSLAGRKILLPLDLLAQAGVYLPRTPETARIVPHDVIMSDLILQFEPERRFAVSELHAGRLPFWSPYELAGVPCYHRCSFSPPGLLRYLIASPVVLAWTQVLVALVAGAGAYVFCRRVLRVGFWPAAIVAWCYPLTGTYIVWQGCGIPPLACWLPWMLTAVDGSVRRPLGWGPPALALLTAVVLVSGQSDVGGQLLLTSGIYAVWCLFDEYAKPWLFRPGTWLFRRACLAGGLTGLAWMLGILASTWLLFPMFEYNRTGSRMIRRSQGEEERPPGGWDSLPQLVLPEIYGLTLDDSFFIGNASNVPESAVAGYAGLWAALLAAPLAWCSRRYRSINLLWLLLAFISVSWVVNVPGMVSLLRMPGLNMMSHNRFVFVFSFAVLAMAAEGLEVLCRREVVRRWWFVLPALVLLGLGGWCVYRVSHLPEPVATQLAAAVRGGNNQGGLLGLEMALRRQHRFDLEGVLLIQHRFLRYYALSAAMAVFGAAGWVLFWFWARWNARRWHLAVLGGMLVGELLWFAYGYNAQCDPGLYYPPIKTLEELAGSPPGRIIGYQCLPTKLAQVAGLRNVRGYDAVDPVRMIDLLLRIAADLKQTQLNPYALTQWLVPKIAVVPPQDARLAPVLDMLGVRYVVVRGRPAPQLHPLLQGDDYWVLANPRALPRAFVPERVETVRDDAECLNKLASPDFDPRRVAYVDSPISPPATTVQTLQTLQTSSCRGSVSLMEDNPRQITLAVDTETPGLVVLADRWDPGWHAYLDGEPVPALRANHAVRGVLVPAGHQTLEWRYEPASLRWGLRTGGLAIALWLGWLGVVGSTSGYRRRWEIRPAVPPPDGHGQEHPEAGRRRSASHPARRRHHHTR